MPILDAAKDVNKAGTSGALDMRTIPSKRPGYFSATPRSCELMGMEMNGLNNVLNRGSIVPAITMANTENFAKLMAIPAGLQSLHERRGDFDVYRPLYYCDSIWR